MNLKISALCLAMLSVGLVACNDDNDQSTPPVVEEATPESISLSLLGRYETGVFAESAAEIPAYDASTKRVFVVNAKKGLVDVLDVSKPDAPVHIGELSAREALAESEVNSVAIKNGIVALAVQAKQKTDKGLVAFFDAKDLKLISKVEVGALPDMLTFTPDGKTVWLPMRLSLMMIIVLILKAQSALLISRIFVSQPQLLQTSKHLMIKKQS